MEVLEELGWMDYLANAQGHRLFALDVSRIKHWLALGVYPTKPVAMALGSYIIFLSIILEKCQKKIAYMRSSASQISGTTQT